MPAQRIRLACLAAGLALATAAQAQVITPPSPVIVPPGRDIAPAAPVVIPAPSPVAPPEIVYMPDAVAEASEDAAASADVVFPPEAPSYSDLCRATPRPPWCEDTQPAPRTP